jgi:hypothetical protein
MENQTENDDDLFVVQYINDYLDCVENLPNDLQRQLSRILDLDATSQSKKKFTVLRPFRRRVFSSYRSYFSFLRMFQNECTSLLKEN